MLLRQSHVLIVLTLVAGCVMVVAQTTKPPDGENRFRGAVLTFVSQRCIPRDKVPYIGDDFVDLSDLITRFRLRNNGPENLFYLADDVSNRKDPVGFQLFRPNGKAEWDAIYSPGRGRDGIFTGVGFKWESLPPGSTIEFEREDMSDKPSEHSTSVFLNTKPVHLNRAELVSNAFSPVRCGK